ncbi:MAG TPA: hypothetical protein VKI44_03595 [Acetobacteraceae bacterium]|nr:hypothetical protein [Acetobacteraceae bacterium]
MANTEQRQAFIAALDAELGRTGPVAFAPRRIIQDFIGRGVPQTTLCMDRALEHERPAGADDRGSGPGG